MILLVMVLAVAAPNPATLDAPRKAYSTCLKGFERKSLAANMPLADYEAGLKTACPDEAAALQKALVAYDVAMGTKRAKAEENAQLDLDDYRLTSQERYADVMSAPR